MVKYDSIHSDLVTFAAAGGLTAGSVCKVTANDTVGACSAGDAFCGVAGPVRGGMTGVQLHGYVKLPYTGAAPTVGMGALAANGSGGVKTAESGRTFCIVCVDTAAKTVGFFL